MFTEKDYESYCSQIIAMENKMENLYRKISGQLEKNEFKVIFDKMIREERDHAERVRELLAILTGKDGAK